ncbi:hypothetical protein RB24_03970 [Herbaspirillum rubrisubalbicans]|uniref:Uncharacterized protein n=1 Tax=Herbaspirillum rubrisubalbicans TaxID=80842 RepID=A0ABX9C774_9BURK|nr:hypothetical protein RB24_03970 [Herbaspirillum rubrisubalbicans]
MAQLCFFNLIVEKISGVFQKEVETSSVVLFQRRGKRDDPKVSSIKDVPKTILNAAALQIFQQEIAPL